jgi:hypothetical protein
MIIDKALRVAAAQALTESGASTDYIDTLAAGDDNLGPYFVVRVDTAVTSGSANSTVAFSLQTSDTATFGTTTTLWATEAIAKATLTAGYKRMVRIPPGVKRYIRGYATIGVTAGSAAALTAGKWDMFFTKDADFNKQLEA